MTWWPRATCKRAGPGHTEASAAALPRESTATIHTSSGGANGAHDTVTCQGYSPHGRSNHRARVAAAREPGNYIHQAINHSLTSGFHLRKDDDDYSHTAYL